MKSSKANQSRTKRGEGLPEIHSSKIIVFYIYLINSEEHSEMSFTFKIIIFSDPKNSKIQKRKKIQ